MIRNSVRRSFYNANMSLPCPPFKARVVRLLCTNHVLREVKSEYFANGRTSNFLVRNEPAQSLLLMKYVLVAMVHILS